MTADDHLDRVADHALHTSGDADSQAALVIETFRFMGASLSEAVRFAGDVPLAGVAFDAGGFTADQRVLAGAAFVDGFFGAADESAIGDDL